MLTDVAITRYIGMDSVLLLCVAPLLAAPRLTMMIITGQLVSPSDGRHQL